MAWLRVQQQQSVLPLSPLLAVCDSYCRISRLASKQKANHLHEFFQIIKQGLLGLTPWHLPRKNNFGGVCVSLLLIGALIETVRSL